MIQIDNALISRDLIDKKFACDLNQCKGICCVEGASGAPLDEDEGHVLKKIYPHVKPYLTKKGISEIANQGYYIVDEDGDYVTPLIGVEECAYSYRENGITKCAIEKAYFKKKISFRKPISCHLYPVRITKYKTFDAVNYDRQYFCQPARTNGKKKGIPVYVFLKDALTRKYGIDWYNQLCYAAKNIDNE